MNEPFLRRVRDWLLEHAATAARAFDGDDLLLDHARLFQAELHRTGFAGIDWPVEYGGQGRDPSDRELFEQEAREHRLPTEPFAIGINMVGPTLLSLGTPAQCARYLPPMLRGEEIWCQLLSEPEAGSDLASVSCAAVPVTGGGFEVTGHKVWSSRAQWADLGVLLARTPLPDAGERRRRHDELSLLIVDMHAPNVVVRPLHDMVGRAVFNEVFLDGVEVAQECLIGPVGGGWAGTMTMLAHERRGTSTGLRGDRGTVTFDQLAAAVRRTGRSGDTYARQRLAEFYVRQRALELLRARLAAETRAGRDIGARGSVAKLAWSGLDRFAADLVSELLSEDVVVWDPDAPHGGQWAAAMSVALSTGIAGGTDEIQRSLIAEHVLGLPKGR